MNNKRRSKRGLSREIKCYSARLSIARLNLDALSRNEEKKNLIVRFDVLIVFKEKKTKTKRGHSSDDRSDLSASTQLH